MTPQDHTTHETLLRFAADAAACALLLPPAAPAPAPAPAPAAAAASRLLSRRPCAISLHSQPFVKERACVRKRRRVGGGEAERWSLER
jgi:hypothetical protein